MVRALVADGQGYLWAATREGVRRYDGYQALPLAQLLTTAQPAAPSGYTNTLVHDAYGRLWIGGVEGLYCWAAGTLTRLPLPIGAVNGTDSEAVYALWLDPRTHLLWVGYSSGRVLVLNPARPAARPALPPSLRENPAALPRPQAARSGSAPSMSSCTASRRRASGGRYISGGSLLSAGAWHVLFC